MVTNDTVDTYKLEFSRWIKKFQRNKVISRDRKLHMSDFGAAITGNVEGGVFYQKVANESIVIIKHKVVLPVEKESCMEREIYSVLVCSCGRKAG